ncbi:MAG: hypothetical protein FJ040_00210 [Chloroflexi bacterium]|nr:hypothetical protein [Chloroflexota bacterium]
MPTVVGIRFKDSGKTYYFDPAAVPDITVGQYVIVETARGLEMARVAELPHDVDESAIVGELKPVVRAAFEEDEVRWKQLNSRQEELIRRCQEKIDEHELPMSLVKAEYSFDGSRLTFYFTADKRVDFRNLVRDLARTFRTRIELRQIGPRDEAKLLGGIGPCGRILCCASFLPDYARVSIKMAKDQDLPLNPAKISGVCGRLLCCLAYEHEQYIEMKAEMPKRGTWVHTPDGPGEVTSVNVLRGTLTVTLAASGVHEEFKPEAIREATEDVATMARTRNAEGVTPVVRERNRGERRLLRDEFESSDMLAALAALEDKPDERASDDVGAATRIKPRGRDDRRPGGPSQGGGNRPQGDRGPRQGPPSGDRPYQPRQSQGERQGPPSGDRPYQPRQNQGERQGPPSGDRPYQPRPNQGDRPNRPQGERQGPRPVRDQQFGPPRGQGERPMTPPAPRNDNPTDDQYSVPQAPPAGSTSADNDAMRRRRRRMN